MNQKKVINHLCAISYYLFGFTWLLVGLTSYFLPRSPFTRIMDYLWIPIFAIPIMLFTVLTIKYSDGKIKGMETYSYFGLLLTILSLLLSYYFNLTHIVPRIVRWFALLLGIAVIGIMKLSDVKKNKLSYKELYGELFGIGFVIIYLVVMIVSTVGYPFGGLSLISGVFALIYGVLLGLNNQ